MGKKKNKKVDPNEGVHSCPMCEKYEPHVRMLHEDRLRGLLFANNNEQGGGTYTDPIVPPGMPDGPEFLESSLPGVFVAGDVRADSVKRVASAVGEGAMAVTLVHRYLEER